MPVGEKGRRGRGGAPGAPKRIEEEGADGDAGKRGMRGGSFGGMRYDEEYFSRAGKNDIPEKFPKGKHGNMVQQDSLRGKGPCGDVLASFYQDGLARGKGKSNEDSFKGEFAGDLLHDSDNPFHRKGPRSDSGNKGSFLRKGKAGEGGFRDGYKGGKDDTGCKGIQMEDSLFRKGSMREGGFKGDASYRGADFGFKGEVHDFKGDFKGKARPGGCKGSFLDESFERDLLAFGKGKPNDALRSDSLSHSFMPHASGKGIPPDDNFPGNFYEKGNSMPSSKGKMHDMAFAGKGKHPGAFCKGDGLMNDAFAHDACFSTNYPKSGKAMAKGHDAFCKGGSSKPMGEFDEKGCFMHSLHRKGDVLDSFGMGDHSRFTSNGNFKGQQSLPWNGNGKSREPDMFPFDDSSSSPSSPPIMGTGKGKTPTYRPFMSEAGTRTADPFGMNGAKGVGKALPPSDSQQDWLSFKGGDGARPNFKGKGAGMPSQVSGFCGPGCGDGSSSLGCGGRQQPGGLCGGSGAGQGLFSLPGDRGLFPPQGATSSLGPTPSFPSESLPPQSRDLSAFQETYTSTHELTGLWGSHAGFPSDQFPAPPAPPAEIAGLWTSGSDFQREQGGRATSPDNNGISGIRTPSDDGFADPTDETVRAAAAAAVARPMVLEDNSMQKPYGFVQWDDSFKSNFEQIRKAQDAAIQMRNEGRSFSREDGAGLESSVAHPPHIMSGMDFMGIWADSKGNAISVYSTDAYSMGSIRAILSRAPRPDIELQILPTEDGGWLCGNSRLDPSASSAARLHWVREDGYISVWTRGRS